MKKIKVYIDKEYISGNTCSHPFDNPMERALCNRMLEKRRTAFIKKLEEEGFEITTDRNDIKDSICLVMNVEAIQSENPQEFREIFHQKMVEGAGDSINIPFSLPIELFDIEPIYPAVFKNEMVNGGEDKLLIETQEQFDKIMFLYQRRNMHEGLDLAFDGCIMQEFIETPTKYTTYIRVYMGAAGNVMGASLKYKEAGTVKKEPTGFFEQIFCNPASPLYLNCKNMFGYYSNGNEISFSQPSYSREKQSILEAHGIAPNIHNVENRLFDPTTIDIPEEILEVCRNMMKNCNEYLGIIVGFDFILNKNDGKWYYLENQAFAAPDEWAKPNGIKIPKSDGRVETYVKYVDIDMQARYYALKAYAKKLELEDEMKLARRKQEI